MVKDYDTTSDAKLLTGVLKALDENYSADVKSKVQLKTALWVE